SPAPGAGSHSEGLSFSDVYERVRKAVDLLTGDEQCEGRPELHNPTQRKGDISRRPFFPAPPTPSLEVRVELEEQKVAVATPARVHFQTLLREQRQRASRAEYRGVFFTLFGLALGALFLTQVWPTLYVPYRNSFGDEISDYRVSRITGKLQRKNKDTGDW